MPQGSGRACWLSLAAQAPVGRDGAGDAEPFPRAPPGATGGGLG